MNNTMHNSVTIERATPDPLSPQNPKPLFLSLYIKQIAWLFRSSIGYLVNLVVCFVMENGIAIADGSKFGEKNGVNNEVTKSRAEENADSGLDGSKDSNGDEVFEEAVAGTPRVDPEDMDANKDENVETIATSKNGNENSDLGNEAEKFEEAIGVSGAMRNAVEESGSKAEFFMNKYSDDNQIAVEKPVTDERNRLMDDSAVENGTGHTISVAAGETENLNDYNEKLGKSSENPETGASDPTEMKILVADIKEEHITEMSETQVVSELKGVDVGSEKPNMKEAIIHEISDIRDANEVKGGDTASEKPVNGMSDHINLAETLTLEDPILLDTDALKEHSHKTSSETQDANVIKGIAIDPWSESESNGSVLHHDETTVVVNFREQVEKSLISGAQSNDDESTELKKPESHSEEADNRDIDVGEHGGISAPDGSASVQVNESSGLDNNLLAEVEESTMNLKVASLPLAKDSVAESVEQPHFFSSELVAENPGASQPLLVCASDEVSEVVVKEQEKEGQKDEKDEQVASGNTEHEVRPVTDISSSYSNSSTSASAAHPVGLECASQIEEPVSQNVLNDREEIIKHAADISSSNANTASPAHPAGREHASLQLEPSQNILGNKEQVIRPAADIPLSSVNSATPARPAGLGRAAPLLEPTSRVVQQPRVNGAVSRVQDQLVEDPTNVETEEYDEIREKLQMIRVKFLRLAHRLGQTPHNVVVAQVLYRLGLAEQLRGRSGSRVAAFSFDRASAMAEQLEAAGQGPLDFTFVKKSLQKSIKNLKFGQIFAFSDSQLCGFIPAESFGVQRRIFVVIEEDIVDFLTVSKSGGIGVRKWSKNCCKSSSKIFKLQ
ncbi:translocase of chloroplast 132, chloroplastic-like [Olea europaea var. sylvestris]|uniref:translocase of chloroplast 132, chloroplastic-like n=1 Tax=Olea europaea var. sylvestris TaxID=158386 RepID=UPI000C1D4725|nr:translocase of chloroplast 132, chloroplastic-like [Olea europaea var. sylvestris]